MRFFTFLVAAMAGTAIALPAAQLQTVNERGLIGDLSGALLGGLTNIVKDVEAGIGADKLEKELVDVLGDVIHKIEKGIKDGSTVAEKLLAVLGKDVPADVIKAIGAAIKALEDNIPVAQVDEYLQKVTHDVITSIEDLFDIKNIISYIHV